MNRGTHHSWCPRSLSQCPCSLYLCPYSVSPLHVPSQSISVPLTLPMCPRLSPSCISMCPRLPPVYLVCSPSYIPSVCPRMSSPSMSLVCPRSVSSSLLSVSLCVYPLQCISSLAVYLSDYLLPGSVSPPSQTISSMCAVAVYLPSLAVYLLTLAVFFVPSVFRVVISFPLGRVHSDMISNGFWSRA
jgi:hypothetical protein